MSELEAAWLCRKLIPQLRVLVADKLTTMHDPITQVQIWRALQAHAQQRKLGLLAISHDVALLRALDARVLHMKDGTLH